MQKFWKVVVLVVLFLGAMLLITFLVPDVRTFATGLASRNNLPIWLVGLASPILFALAKLKDLLGGLVGESTTEKDIREKNEAVKAKLADLEQSVNSLDAWRKEEMDRRMNQVNAYNTTIATMESRENTLDQSIGSLQERREALKNVIREDPGNIE